MPNPNLCTLEINDFVKKLLQAYRKTHSHFMLEERGAIHASPTLPIMVGAGLSWSAQIPLNNELLRNCNDILFPEENRKHMSYKRVYEHIRKELGSTQTESHFKFKLRNLLTEAGIPRDSDQVFPNLSNSLLIHLVRYKFFGPVISFNVDPLLSTAAQMTSRPNLPIQFVDNIGQFSDMVGKYGLKTDLDSVIFQPHGTIEEPFSLRFLDDELMDQKKAIQQAVLNSLKSRTSLVCAGLSLKDKMTLQFVKEWKDDHKGEKLNFYVSLYEKETPKNIHSKLNKLASANLIIHVANGVDSDKFFTLLADKVVGATAKDRGKSTCRFHVPPVTQIHIRDIIYKPLSNARPTSKDWDNGKTLIPDIVQQAILEIAILCITSRGPFSMVDAFNVILTEDESDASRSRSANSALRSLLQNEILSYCSCGDESTLDCSYEPSFSGIDDILRTRLIRNKNINTIESFTDKICGLLGIHLSKIDQRRLCSLFKKLELNRESPYSLGRAVITDGCFSESSSILQTHEDLNRHMDALKKKFKTYVKQGFPVKCCIITETGEHLFQKDKLKIIGKVENATPSKLESTVREWILPIYKHEGSGTSPRLQILVAANREDWWFIVEERRVREKIISRLLGYMEEAPCIKIKKIPWDKHHDHMWFYSLESENKIDFQGIYFPRAIDTQSYCGIRVISKEDIKKLEDVFDFQIGK